LGGDGDDDRDDTVDYDKNGGSCYDYIGQHDCHVVGNVVVVDVLEDEVDGDHRNDFQCGVDCFRRDDRIVVFQNSTRGILEFVSHESNHD